MLFSGNFVYLLLCTIIMGFFGTNKLIHFVSPFFLEYVMELTKIKRVNENELQFRNMLSNYRIGTPTMKDILTTLDEHSKDASR